MTDDRDWLDQTRSLMEKRSGQTPSEDDMIAHFVLHGPDQRIRILHAMDGEPQGEIIEEETAMRRAADRAQLRQRFGEVHLMGLRSGR